MVYDFTVHWFNPVPIYEKVVTERMKNIWRQLYLQKQEYNTYCFGSEALLWCFVY